MEIFIKESSVSTILFFEESIDHILGYLKINDFINLKKKDIPDLLRKPLFIPENKHILPLLSEFKEKGNYIAIVLDEFGGTAGLVTLRDILDAIFIRDMLLSKYIRQWGRNRWIVLGNTKISDINASFELDLPVESNTISGYLVNILGRIPETGSTFDVIEGYTVKVSKSDRRQIESLEFSKP
jgi:putative hemolysin